ncbi:MAG TPA: hypothetical protein VGO11_27820 [Chthoniobacteraceae bacterium]|jgi:hypothetical protein|nr:hypothetical protein [Chthoniobacteraceae bacterium]
MELLSPLLLWVALLIGGLAGLWMTVLGFRRHWAWGLGLCLPQIAQGFSIFAFFQGTEPSEPAYVSLNAIGAVLYLCFLVAAWPETRSPFFWWLTSVGLMVLFFLTLFETNGVMSAHVARLLRARGVTHVHIDRFDNALESRFQRGRPANAPPLRGPRISRDRNETAPAAPTPPPVFRSRLPAPAAAPGEREPAQPGIYYLLERVTVTTAKGVKAGLPGEKVILLQRLPGNKMKVTVDDADFIVHTSQVTDDIRVARELEKQDFVARGGTL